jgi:hypothetical protein
VSRSCHVNSLRNQLFCSIYTCPRFFLSFYPIYFLKFRLYGLCYADKSLCWNLTFMEPCIVNVFSSITNKMQRYTMYLLLWNALHVSGESSAHHQELKTVYSGTSSNSSTRATGSSKAWEVTDAVYTVLSSW